MSPFLLPLILMIYGEKSKDILTRYVARITYYTYTSILILSINLPPQSWVLLVILGVSTLSYSYLFYTVKVWRVRILLIGLSLLQVVNYISLYLVSYELYYMIPFYMEYSNIIMRELTVMAISMINIDRKVDTKLKIGLLGLYIVEYSYLVGV